VPEDGLRQNY